MTAAVDDALLQLRGIGKVFTGVAALRDINLTVRAGQVHTLLGENGAGKSTLIKILAGVHQPSGGSMTLDGAPYAPASPREAAARGIAVVFQELSLCNNLTVAENILATREPARYGFINRKALYRRARQLVDELQLPVDVEARVADLSIAQRQLVEIAKGLSHEAKVVILDEPTSSLSDAEAEMLFAIIARLKAAGKAVIYISHRMEEIMRLSDEITVMRDGQYITTLPRSETSVAELIALMVGRRMDQMYPPRLPETPPPDAAPPALEVRALTHTRAFRDVSFAVHPGEILGFFGLVGAGRSEVMNAVFGMLPAHGEVRLDDESVRIRHPADAIHYGIGFVTENRKEQGLVLAHSVRRNTSMAALKRFAARFGFLRFAAEREAAELLAKAREEADIMRGEADASAAKQYAAAYGADLDFYRYWRSLTAYRDSLGGSTLIVKPDNRYFRYLNNEDSAPLDAETAPATLPAPTIAPVADPVIPAEAAAREQTEDKETVLP